jgi:hypothetical protein
MATTFYGEPEWWVTTQLLLNETFTLIFTIEAGLKLYAFGLAYFKDGWNRFDFAVVVGSWLDIILTYFAIELFSSSLFRIVRIARVIGRVTRLLKVASASSTTLGIEQIVTVFTTSLPQVANIAVLILLILFIFAVLGMNLFGTLVRNGCINSKANFERVPVAMLTLFGIATKDRVTCLTIATMVEEPTCSQENGTCGDATTSKLYFVAFSLCMIFTTIQFFVNVILQNFEDLTTTMGLPVTLHHMRQFVEIWQDYDPDGKGEIEVDALHELLKRLPRQIGCDPLAGEDEIDPGGLQLPPLPDGRFSRLLLRSDDSKLKNSKPGSPEAPTTPTNGGSPNGKSNGNDANETSFGAGVKAMGFAAKLRSRAKAKQQPKVPRPATSPPTPGPMGLQSCRRCFG